MHWPSFSILGISACQDRHQSECVPREDSHVFHPNELFRERNRVSRTNETRDLLVHSIGRSAGMAARDSYYKALYTPQFSYFFCHLVTLNICRTSTSQHVEPQPQGPIMSNQHKSLLSKALNERSSSAPVPNGSTGKSSGRARAPSIPNRPTLSTALGTSFTPESSPIPIPSSSIHNKPSSYHSHHAVPQPVGEYSCPKFSVVARLE